MDSTKPQFTQIQAFKMGFEEFKEFLKELLDDPEIEIHDQNSKLFAVSEKNPEGWDNKRIQYLVGGYLGINVVSSVFYLMENAIYFIGEEN